MSRTKLVSCLTVIVAFTVGLAGLSGTACAHGGGGGGGGHGGGGHGGGHGGGGHYGGGHYGGGGYYGGGGFYGGFYPGFGFYGPGYGYGYGSGYGGYYGNGYYNQQYYNQPAYATSQYQVSNTVPSVPAPDGGQIVLFVPGDAASGISYTLNGQAFSLLPGESQKLVNDRQWIVEFAPTSGQIALRYTLISAKFKFKPSGTGMGLFQTQDSPTPKAVEPSTPPTPNPPSD